MDSFIRVERDKVGVDTSRLIGWISIDTAVVLDVSGSYWAEVIALQLFLVACLEHALISFPSIG